MESEVKKILFFILATSFITHASVSYSDTTLTEGLIGYYSFNGNANDESLNNNHLNISGATLTEDRLGVEKSAYYFDGVDDYMEDLDFNGLPDGNEARSITAWINSAGVPQGNPNGDPYQAILGWGTTFSDNSAFAIERGGDPSNPNGYDNNLFVLGWNNDYSGSEFIEFGEWYHIAVTFDGTNLNLFINGSNDGSATKQYNTVLNEYGLRIGWLPTPTGDDPIYSWHTFFFGALDDIRIYNRALTPSEVVQIYNYEQSYNVVPEPSAILLLALGLVTMIWIKKSKYKF